MKEIIQLLVAVVVMGLLIAYCSGCTSTVTHYDADGRVIKVEEATNFSRAMDGTNSKSQIVTIDGTFISFEASATAGENCTPGIVTKFANGKTAFVNAKDEADFTGASDVIEKFYSGSTKVGTDGVSTGR
jgi:hypothetical protein